MRYFPLGGEECGRWPRRWRSVPRPSCKVNRHDPKFTLGHENGRVPRGIFEATANCIPTILSCELIERISRLSGLRFKTEIWPARRRLLPRFTVLSGRLLRPRVWPHGPGCSGEPGTIHDPELEQPHPANRLSKLQCRPLIALRNPRLLTGFERIRSESQYFEPRSG
jgi:hypothetical protein